jgi:hypothetical protein
MHKKIVEWEWFAEPNVFHVFSYLLLTVKYADQFYKGKLIKRGQTLTSCEKIAEKTGLTRQKIRTVLDKLIQTNVITISSTNRNSIITIVNWDKYQLRENVSANYSTNEPTIEITTNQPTITKEYKNNKNINILSFEPETDSNNENKKSKKTTRIYDHESKYYKSALWLSNKILENNPNLKPKDEQTLQAWSDVARMILEIDKWGDDNFRLVLSFSQHDDFWRKNILSMGKLRKQFETLLAKASD